MLKKSFSADDIVLDVEFTATPYIPATYDDPAEGGEVEVQAIYLEGLEISGILAQWVLDLAEEVAGDSATELMRDQRESDMEDEAEARNSAREEEWQS
jgi:hypothetical protein